jgi:leucyl aminopeptidase
MQITFAKPVLPDRGTLVVGIPLGGKLGAGADQLDRALGGSLRRAIETDRFKGRPDQTVSLVAPGGGLARVLVVGIGKAEDLNALRMQAAGGRIFAALGRSVEGSATVWVDAVEGAKIGPAEMASNLAYGARLRSYRFDRYKTKKPSEDEENGEAGDITLTGLVVLCDEPESAGDRYDVLDKVADAVFLTRELVSEPANVLYPEALAARAKELSEVGVDVEVFGEAQMREMGMNALLGVGQGSARESQLVVMQWNGVPEDAAKGKTPVAFIGKGVTFDTGGISIKPAASMEDMKWDMGGAGVVIGLMKALAGRKARVNAVGLIGLVENMPSGTAQRPGDIVKSMSGQTIEILNTDAEGRLVLADVLWYCKERFKPKIMVDLATLTGAIIISLGHEKAGLFSNNDELAKRLFDAGEAVGEGVWRMPLASEYDKLIKSDVADMQNIGQNRGAGSITAAQFLQRFVGDVPWAHLDIAGVTWAKKGKPTVPKGGTAFGVRLLDRLIADYYEAG